MLKHHVPGSAASLDAARAVSLAGIPDGPAKVKGIAAGEAAAAAIVAARAGDGSGAPEFYLPFSSNPGEWRLTPSCPAAGGIFLHWRNVRTFGIESAGQFRSDPPPALVSPRYTRDYREVKRVGGVAGAERPEDRADVARFYNAVLAVDLWNRVAAQVAAVRETSLSENARTFALLNMAISDSLVAVMETKYHYKFWHPETAIMAGGTDGNPHTEPDFSFVPFIATPCFPSYPSGHAAASYAACEVLDDARVYGGIHFRFDQETGAEQGRRIGRYIYRHKLGRVNGSNCGRDKGARSQ